jgi:hypothetical protein
MLPGEVEESGADRSVLFMSELLSSERSVAESELMSELEEELELGYELLELSGAVERSGAGVIDPLDVDPLVGGADVVGRSAVRHSLLCRVSSVVDVLDGAVLDGAVLDDELESMLELDSVSLPA